MATHPTGIVKTPLPGGNGGVTWEDVTQYDEFISKECQPVGWPVERVRAHIVIESQGIAKALQENDSNGYSYGLMQVVPYGIGWDGWHKLVKEKAGLPANASREKVIRALYDPAINIACGVAILESFYQQYGTTDKASSAFFTGRADWGAGDTVNGTTGKQYQTAVNGLIAEQKTFETDLVALVMGTSAYNLTFDWKEYGGPDFYRYGVGHGTDGSQHTGLDIVAAYGSPLYAAFDGDVVCGATNWGSGAWQTGCAAFGDTMGGGSGRVEILHTDGIRSLIYGHCHDSLVSPGQRVKAGERIATVGGMNNAWHVHLEARKKRGTSGDYVIHDPRELFADLAGAPVNPPKAERLPIPQPEEFDTTVAVTVIADSLPVLQRADLNASPVSDPLTKGETFQAVYQAVGNDGRIYWISNRAGRVPVEGTSAPDWKGGTVSIGGGITQESLDVLVDTLDHIVINHEADISSLTETGKALRAVITALVNLKGA